MAWPVFCLGQVHFAERDAHSKSDAEFEVASCSCLLVSPEGPHFDDGAVVEVECR